jgi:hypothetical protein
MSHHRNAICQSSGKVRYREPRDVKFALRRADGDRDKARLNGVRCGRRETSSYPCSDCGGWHLTSQQARPARLISRPELSAHRPGPAADAIRRMAATTGLTAGVAA